MIRNVSIPATVAGALFFLALTPGSQAASLSGAIFTTTVNGSAVNANLYTSKCAVYLDGGPGPHAPAKAAGLPDGDYYFQVTDPSGAQLLSTDPVSNRRFHVSSGVITAFTGTGGPAHPTGIDQDHAELGAITISLANATCPTDFLNTPDVGFVYKVWATPVASYVGNPANVDNPCSGGCSHGFVPSHSKTDNFKAQPGAAATFCLVLQKQLNAADGLSPLPGWVFTVSDGSGVTNSYTTDSTGQVTVCQLLAGSYSVQEDFADPNQPPPFKNPPSGCNGARTGVYVNGAPVDTPSPLDPITFNWTSTQPSTMTVLFQNTLVCVG